MSRIKDIDKVLTELNKCKLYKDFVTVGDVRKRLNIDDNEVQNMKLKKSMEYLKKIGLCDSNSNAYSINFEGEIFIEETPFWIRKRPFLYRKRAKELKIVAIGVNALAILTLSILSFGKKNKNSEKEKIKSEQNITAKDSLKIN